MINMYRLLILALIFIFLVGCATWEEYKLGFKLEEIIGTMTYDEALSTWGEPISIFQGDKIFVVTWGSEKVGPVITTATPVGNAAIVATNQSRSGWKISATFSIESRILKSIHYTGW